MRAKTAPGRQYTPFFAPGSWFRAWVITALIGNALLALIFVGYEIAERLWLRAALPVETLFLLHIYRGVFASVVLGSWAFYNIWRLRRKYDAAFESAYDRLTEAVAERTRELEKAHAFTDRLFDALRERLMVLDRDCTVIKANRVAVEAGGGDLLVGRPCNLLGPTCTSHEVCAAQRALRTGRPVVGQLIRSERDPERVFSVDAYPLPDAREDLVIAVARDVTDAEQLQAQLRNQEKLAALGVLASGVAHDIGNPLASLSSELELLEEEKDPSRVHASLRVVRDHVERIGRVLREMTDFARRRTEELSSVPVAVAVDDALRLVRHDPRARRVAFTTRIPEGLRAVRMVEDHLVMALVNLLINALDAMPDGGEITIRAEEIGDHLRLSVTDTGAGMSEEVRRRATEPLFTTKTGGRGTGLGLSITADVVARAGGSLDVDSAPGLGTTVHLGFPVASHA